jgi:hypothetical protein
VCIVLSNALLLASLVPIAGLIGSIFGPAGVAAAELAYAAIAVGIYAAPVL